MYGNAPQSHLTGVPGWESHDEQELLRELAAQVPKGGAIVEIGAEFGMSSSIWCKFAAPEVEIYSIDLFPGSLLEEHRDNLRLAGLLRNQQIKASSAEAAKEWEAGNYGNTRIGLLFVDGDHSYPGVLKDIQDWHSFVIPGGFMIFHDCACETNKLPHPLHHEVMRAVKEWFDVAKHEGWTLAKMVDSTMAFKFIPPVKPSAQEQSNVPEGNQIVPTVKPKPKAVSKAERIK